MLPVLLLDRAIEDTMNNNHVLDRLINKIASRREDNLETSYTARLLSSGPVRSAQKVGEEAVEVAIEATLGNTDTLISESADLLYHLLVLWVSMGVSSHKVWAKLEAREKI
ncbi:Phosphoribosyl-ATP pyrophosphatase [Candidatus Endolissoclinum faulkneri L2]|uniref:Phosphoribosyl-ATP pyrophosphatase n=2 Tax=Candidatus Endolissoclinum faulkneri TaxID=1263979 RepID=K7Z355_9PROT|nr:Phosphoribosyl-ATP pyrophosphatase [Candidatus Endolissoclinum faulkneri L2]